MLNLVKLHTFNRCNILYAKYSSTELLKTLFWKEGNFRKIAEANIILEGKIKPSPNYSVVLLIPPQISCRGPSNRRSHNT